MWSRCGKCNGSSKSTKRILISNAARCLSFGKFLELSFSKHSFTSSPASCGHSFHKDFIFFFGSGPLVAIFKYSPVTTYSVALPPPKMAVKSSVREDFLKKDIDSVYMKGIAMFQDVEKSLEELQTRYVGVTLNIQGSSKKLSDIKEMLKQDKSLFEVEMQKAVKIESSDEAVYKLLSLNKVRLELLLESYVWALRLHSLQSSDPRLTDSKHIAEQVQDQPLLEQFRTDREAAYEVEIMVENSGDILETSSGLQNKLEGKDFPVKDILIDGQAQESGGHDASMSTSIQTENVKEIPIDGQVQESEGCESVSTSLDTEAIVKPTVDGRNEDELGISESLVKSSLVVHSDGGEKSESNNSDTRKLQLATNMKGAGSYPNNDKVWMWAPFSEIRQGYMEELQRGHVPTFESLSISLTESMEKVIVDEGSRLHIPLGIKDYITSDYEDEFSSIIACALSLLKDSPMATENLDEDARKEKLMRSHESAPNLTRTSPPTSPHWTSFGSLNSNSSILSPSTKSLEESHSLSFSGLNMLDSLVSYGASHPEVSMGPEKTPGKRKYSVVCLYADQFSQLRDRCCHSELDFIASLSRCRNWDAKGGKSKSFFAKTLDDRFIVKEIQRTEYDSFMKFASNYFGYMNECYEQQNQTCLAKILGIYQVTKRATKNGKESRHDLLVMENLSLGRKLARQYDLKGALHARFTSASKGSADVLLDQNFVNDMNISPLYVSQKSKRNLQRAVWNDTAFLKSINVMDYSLLVGVDTQHQELVCGIIDYLRQYTWDKQLENWVKSSLVVPKNQLPTIISPQEYKKRFRKFIDTHFLSVPDNWCSKRSAKPCNLCSNWQENASSDMMSPKC